jgi:hypothetical protein
MRPKDVAVDNSKAAPGRTRDLKTIDTELGLLPTLRRAPRERGGQLPSIVAADALLDERRESSQPCVFREAAKA